MRYLLVLLSLLLLSCATSDLESQTADYHEQIMSSIETNDDEVNEPICTLVSEAIDYIQATPELKAEVNSYDEAVTKIEQEHSGLILRVQALQEEIASGKYPHLVTRNVWRTAERDCVDAGHTEEREETS